MPFKIYQESHIKKYCKSSLRHPSFHLQNCWLFAIGLEHQSCQRVGPWPSYSLVIKLLGTSLHQDIPLYWSPFSWRPFIRGLISYISFVTFARTSLRWGGLSLPRKSYLWDRNHSIPPYLLWSTFHSFIFHSELLFQPMSWGNQEVYVLMFSLIQQLGKELQK